MKRILMSILVIGLVAISGFGMTKAYFSDVETSESNTFAAGAIDLMVDYTSTYNGVNDESWSLKDLTPSDRLFNISDVKPGDYGSGVASLHVFNNDAFLYAQVVPQFNDDFSSTEPELDVDAAENPADAWDGELADNLEWTIWIDEGGTAGWQGTGTDPLEGDNIMNGVETAWLTGDAGDLGSSPTGWVYLGQLDTTETFYLGASWNVDLGVGNEVQTDRYQADVSFLAVQERHMVPGVLPAPVPTP